MSFPIPRRQRFPLPLGDNSPYTPPDPEPGIPYKLPDPWEYQLARDQYIETGDLEALWRMEDNVSLAPSPSPALQFIAATPTLLEAEAVVAAHRPPRRVSWVQIVIALTALWQLIYWLVLR